MTRFLCMLLLPLIGFASSAAAEPRKPTARWVVNYDDAQCVATRNYGTEDKPLILALKPSATASVVRLMMIRKGLALEPEQRSASLRFDDKASIAVSALTYRDTATGHFVAAVNLPMSVFKSNSRAATISFRGAAFDEQLAVPGFAGISAAFDDCLANLRQVWNVGAPHASRLKQQAEPIRALGGLFNSATYPQLAIQEHNSGIVAVSMLIDEEGKVRDCMIEETSGFASLDTTSCFVFASQARFRPAIGVDGKPAKSAFHQRINWRLRI